MDLDDLTRFMGEVEKEQLRDELHRLEETYRMASSAQTLEELRVTADRRVQQLRFFVDLMQGYQLIVQLAERGLRKPQQPPVEERHKEADP